MIHGIGDQLHFDGQSAHDLRTSALVQRSVYGRGCDRLEGLRLLKRFVEAFNIPIKTLGRFSAKPGTGRLQEDSCPGSKRTGKLTGRMVYF